MPKETKLLITKLTLVCQTYNCLVAFYEKPMVLKRKTLVIKAFKKINLLF